MKGAKKCSLIIEIRRIDNMPLPFIIGGVAVVAGLTGVGKSRKKI